MKVRSFELVNEKGQTYSLMSTKKGCLFKPNNLGYGYSTEFQQVGHQFFENVRKIKQGNISGTMEFETYDNYSKLIDFIEYSKKIKWEYTIPYSSGNKTFYKDVLFEDIEKVDIFDEDSKLIVPVEFDCLSLWYEQNETIFRIETFDEEMRYDYRWNSRYIDYNTRAIEFDNKGHVDAPLQVEIAGFVQNPAITVIVDNEVYATIKVNVTIYEYEKFLYSSKTGDIYIQKQNRDGTTENLFKKKYGIDINKQNIFKLPIRSFRN